MKYIKTVMGEQFLLDILTNDQCYEIIEDNLPSDAKLYTVYYNPFNNMVELYFVSNIKGTEVKEGESIIDIEITYNVFKKIECNRNGNSTQAKRLN